MRIIGHAFVVVGVACLAIAITAGLVAGAFLPLDECGLLNNGMEYQFQCPIVLPPRCDIGMIAISDTGTANVVAMGTFSGWLERVA